MEDLKGGSKGEEVKERKWRRGSEGNEAKERKWRQITDAGYQQYKNFFISVLNDGLVHFNITWKLTKRHKCWVNIWVTFPRHFQFLSIVTQKLRNFRIKIPRNIFKFQVTLPWKCFEKILFLWISPRKENIFKNILGTMDSWKQPDFESLMLLSL